ncbi:MAG: hypothetical protein JWO79_938, partial [Actinomycetia bacterium]|nr:hypothetical protein [Actinomycetes bacterium]
GVGFGCAVGFTSIGGGEISSLTSQVKAPGIARFQVVKLWPVCPPTDLMSRSGAWIYGPNSFSPRMPSPSPVEVAR